MPRSTLVSEIRQLLVGEHADPRVAQGVFLVPVAEELMLQLLPPSAGLDGYFATGDLGAWVDDAYLVVTGRAKDIVIRNGENISPKEVEDLLAGHPGIAEVAVVGLPDARTGERACAVIVAAGEDAPDVESLRDFLLGRGVAKFKVPEQVAIWDALPKNDAGKVLKHRIRAALDAAEVR